jgi:hypothetical protein
MRNVNREGVSNLIVVVREIVWQRRFWVGWCVRLLVHVLVVKVVYHRIHVRILLDGWC